VSDDPDDLDEERYDEDDERAETVVTIEGKDAKLSDLQPGQKVVITPDTGTATKIEVPTPKAKKDAK